MIVYSNFECVWIVYETEEKSYQATVWEVEPDLSRYPRCQLCGSPVDVSGGRLTRKEKKLGLRSGCLRFPENKAECYICPDVSLEPKIFSPQKGAGIIVGVKLVKHEKKEG